MKNLYFGTKTVNATVMNRQDYNDYRGWGLPSDENGGDDGYLVEYLDGGQANHPNHKGYISWSPKEVFDNDCKTSGELTFGMAIEALKLGLKVSRSGWNGKSMWLILVKGTGKKVNMVDGSVYHTAGINSAEILPHIDMCTASGAMLCGWLASQTDILSDDWCIVT